MIIALFEWCESMLLWSRSEFSVMFIIVLIGILHCQQEYREKLLLKCGVDGELKMGI